jgi:NDP-sugar pyrophosphorylase family protein
MTETPPSFPVAILAGGLATRLKPVTERIPKALVEVAGRPFLEHQVELLKRNGITKLVLCVGHLGHMIREMYGDGSSLNVEILYSEDGERLLGTGGALRKALPLLGESFFVLYGDSYLPISYQPVAQAFIDSGKEGLMTVYQNEGQWDTSNVVYADDHILLYDKHTRDPRMRHIDYGLSVLSARAVRRLPENEPADLANLLIELVAKNELAGYEVTQRFYEIGSHAGLAELNALLS